MRIRCGTIHIVALVALAVGAAAGWFAAHDGRERSPSVPDAKVNAHPASDIASQCSRCSGDMRASDQSTRTSGVGAHRPAANVVDKPRHAAVKVNADERREADTAKQEEKPVQVAQSFRARTTRSWCVRHARKTRRFSSAFAQSRNVFE